LTTQPKDREALARDNDVAMKASNTVGPLKSLNPLANWTDRAAD
jgi:hypothetical protein